MMGLCRDFSLPLVARNDIFAIIVNPKSEIVNRYERNLEQSLV